jgi:hypothetical protein
MPSTTKWPEFAAAFSRPAGAPLNPATFDPHIDYRIAEKSNS